MFTILHFFLCFIRLGPVLDVWLPLWLVMRGATSLPLLVLKKKSLPLLEVIESSSKILVDRTHKGLQLLSLNAKLTHG
jgi:hypothetical protein